MASATALVWDLIARDAASPTFNRVAASADRAAVATDRAAASGAAFGKKVMAGFAGFAVADLLGHAVSSAINFQKQMALIQTQAGASAKQVQNFSKAILSLSGQVATAPEQLSTSLYHAFSATHKYAQSLQVVKIAAEGAKVGNADLEETTNALTSAVVSGIKGVSNMQQAMGALNAIVGAGDMKLSDLNDALGTGLLAVAKSFNVSLVEVGGALATFGDNNIRGAQAATQLRMSILALAKPIQGGEAALEKIGESGSRLQNILARHGLDAALKDLKVHMEQMGITGGKVGTLLEDAFGRRAGVGITILEDQLGRVLSKTQDVADGAHNMASAWHATTQTAAFQLSKLGAEFQAAGIAIGTKLLPVVSSAAHWIGTTLPKAASTLWKALQPLAESVGHALVTAWHGLLDVLKPIGSMLAGVGHWMASNSGIVKVFGTTVLGLWTAFKGYTIIKGAALAIRAFATSTMASFRGGIAAVSQWGAAATATFNGTATESERASLIMQRDMLAIGRQAAILQAETDELAAQTAEAYAMMTRSSSEWSAAAVMDANAAAAAARAQANASAEAAAEVAASATAASRAVDEAGAAASLGWESMLGPLAIVGGALALFSGSLFHSGDAASATAADVNSLTDAINQDSGALGKNTRAQVVNNLQKSGALSIARQLLGRDALGGLTTAAMQGGAALDSLIVRLNKIAAANRTYRTTEAGKTIATGYNEQGQAALKLIGILRGENGAVKTSVQNYRDKKAAMDGATGATNRQAAATQGLATAVDLSTRSINNQIAAMQHAQNVQLAQKSATDAFKLALLQMGGQLANNKHTLDDNTQAGLQNRSAIEQIIGQAQQAAHQMGKGSAYELALAGNIQQLIDQAGKYHMNTHELMAMLRQMHLIPKDIRSKVDLQQYEQTKNDLATLGKMVRDLEGRHVVSVVVENTGGGDYLHGNTGSGSEHHHRGKKSASGGPINGPGSGTSDSIPAWLSNGEYVINAAQAKKHRALLDAINYRAPGFKSGGLVGLAESAGWHGRNAQIAAAVAMAESGGSRTAHNYNPSTGDDSYGLWQVNLYGPLRSRLKTYHIGQASNLYNPQTNARVAHAIWAGSGWGNWTTYRDGAYLQFMGQNGRVTGGGGGGGGSAAQQRQAARQAMHSRRQSASGVPNDFGSLIHNLDSVSGARSSMRSLIGDMRGAGASDRFIAELRRESAALQDAVRKRLRDEAAYQKAQAREQKAHQNYLNWLGKERQEAATVRQAARSGFDVTSAGVGQNGVFSVGRFEAQQKQYLAKVRKWIADIKVLEKVFGKSPAGMQMLRSWVEAGPDATWAVVDGLAHHKGQLRSILATEAQIDKITARFGEQTGRFFYGDRVRSARENYHDRRHEANVAKRQVERDKRHEDRLAHKIGEQIENRLRKLRNEDNLPDWVLHRLTRELARMVETGNNKNKGRR